MDVLQWPNFTKRVDELSDLLDSWLCFLDNAERWSPDNLPESLRTVEVEEAMNVPRAISQDDIEWHRRFGWEKARLDARNWELSFEKALADIEAAKAKAADALRVDLVKDLVEEQARMALCHAETVAARVQLEAAQAQSLVGRIRDCEESLGLAPLPEKRLQSVSVEELEDLLVECRRRKGW